MPLLYPLFLKGSEQPIADPSIRILAPTPTPPHIGPSRRLADNPRPALNYRVRRDLGVSFLRRVLACTSPAQLGQVRVSSVPRVLPWYLFYTLVDISRY